jgi:hypothetical protein
VYLDDDDDDDDAGHCRSDSACLTRKSATNNTNVKAKETKKALLKLQHK